MQGLPAPGTITGSSVGGGGTPVAALVDPLGLGRPVLVYSREALEAAELSSG